jgi:nitroreductase
LPGRISRRIFEMNVEDAIRTRRSIRHYKADSIPREIIEKLILNAAIWAPSGGNCQYWRFDIVDEPTLLAKVKMLSPGMLGNPPVVVVICQDEQKVKEKWGDIGTHLSAMDSAMAGQNLMLAAHSQGFGTCAIASFHAAALQKLLKLPASLSPQLLVSVGIPAQSTAAPKRKEDVIWWNEYAHEL